MIFVLVTMVPLWIFWTVIRILWGTISIFVAAVLTFVAFQIGKSLMKSGARRIRECFCPNISF